MGSKNNPGQFDCYENAEPDEPMFVLLGRDPQAGEIVRDWVKFKRAEYLSRKPIGALPTPKQQAKLDEALACAAAMDQWKVDHQ